MDPGLRDWIKERNEKVKEEMQRPKWMKEPWYHGRIDRATTDTILAGTSPGRFLVRDSSTCPGDYVLSVSENNKVSHYIVSRRGGMYLIGDQTFTELPAVIEFYRKHFLDTTTLRDHASKLGDGGGGGGGSVMPRPLSDQPDSAGPGQALPPPIPVVGKLIVKGKFDFKSDDPEDLHFKKGELLEVLRKDEDDWWYAKRQDGQTGSIPVPYVVIVEDNSQPFYAKATMDRECPYDPTALSFKVGDMIKVTKMNENGMWEGELNGKRGHFPFKLVEVLSTSNHQ